ncbi:MAG: DegV family protein [Lachnospiraceae bacterium]
MKYKIVCDSCTDLTREDRQKEYFASVPLTLLVDDEEIIDDDNFNQKYFLDKVKECKGGPKSACPAPEVYMEEYKDADEVYVVTLSANLSGSYNSAELAKNLYFEEYGEKKIHIFNSKSASAGQYLIAKRIERLAKDGKEFEEIVENIEQYISEQHTYFVLETLDVLRKNGRLSKVQALLAGTLNIKPIMASTDEGEITKKSQVRGMKKALTKMVELIVEETKGIEEKEIVISHCNCPERALKVKDDLLALAKVKKIEIIETWGLSSLYACDGGIIICL